jgi:DNA-binding transcriptional LysR family regulator
MDLNDLRYFSLVVEHGGFSAAERQIHVPKSKLSRRVSFLEERLGTRLLQRSTRRLALTEAGRAFYEHCAAMVIEAEAAQQAIELLHSEPTGTVRLSCPLSMAHYYVARLIGEFMQQHPKVRVEFDATDRVVNLIEERVDIALRARDSGIADVGLTARRIASGRLVLVASPGYVAARPPVEEIEAIARLDTIGPLIEGAEQSWSLVSSDGRSARVLHRPRLLCSDFVMQYQAAIAGAGIALLPLRLAWRALSEGSLARVGKDWSTPALDIYLVFPSRRGMLPSVRTLVDFLAQRVPTAMGE